MLDTHAGLFSIALTLALLGFVANYFWNDKLKSVNMRGSMRLLGVPVGSGAVGLFFVTVLLGALTVACFWQASFFTFFPGINVAFELGGIGALWIGLLRAGSSST